MPNYIPNLQTELTDLGIIRISGHQNEEFLQGQLSCDVNEVTSTQTRLGAHCNAKGRVLAIFRLYYIAPDYYLLLPQSLIESLLNDLNQYALFYQVKLEAVSHQWQKIGLSGSTLTNHLNRYWPHLVLEEDSLYYEDNQVILTLPGLISRVIILSPLPKTLPSALNITHTTHLSYWHYLDIENGLATIYPTTRALFTPHQLNFHNKKGVSFTKGCYTGQEVIARMQYLGKLKNKLYKLTVYSEIGPTPGTAIVDTTGKLQGTVIIAAPENDNTALTYKALASLPTMAITQPLYLGTAPIQMIEAT